MITFMESKDSDKCLDSQLWHACAGSMVEMPPLNSRVFYFPQGHAEHACGHVDFRNCPKLPSFVSCRVSGVKFMADLESDEVFAKIRLMPVNVNDADVDVEEGRRRNKEENQEKIGSFAKTLTQSDANNGGGFSVPRYCAETIFPRLDYSVDPPLQTIYVKDVHGLTWKFRHIYRGTPRRHLLTTGWSTFVNQKKLVAGDSIVFLRAENGDLFVGIRRAKRGGLGGGSELPVGWTLGVGNSDVFPSFLREDENKLMKNSNNGSSGKVKPESVIEAATCAANGQPFEVVYYPRASTPEFCVKSTLVKAAMQVRWCSGMRFKMAFETEDSSRISWFMGTISSAQVVDPVLWPDSPWRLLQVTWDEPELLQNVKRVNPWLVEFVSNMPAIQFAAFSPPLKKMRSQQQHPEFQMEDQLHFPRFYGNNFLGPSRPMGCFPENTPPAGMQGARHASYGFSLSDIHFRKLQSNVFPVFPDIIPVSNKPSSNYETVSCLLTMGSPSQTIKKCVKNKPSQFVLFGQPILTEQETLEAVSPVHGVNSSSDGSGSRSGSGSGSGLSLHNKPDQFDPSESGQCKVFMESDNVGHTLNLSMLGSYEEVYSTMSTMFGIGVSEAMNRVRYRDVTGSVRKLGDEPFSDFIKTTTRLTISIDSSNESLDIVK